MKINKKELKLNELTKKFFFLFSMNNEIEKLNFMMIICILIFQIS